MPAGRDPILPHGDGDQVVQVKRRDSCAATDRATYDHDAIGAPVEVTAPPLSSRVEQSHQATGEGIATVGLVGFMQVARPTRQPEVFLIVSAAFGPGNDVLHIQASRHIFLPRQAVATAISRRSADTRANSLRDSTARHDSSGLRRPRRTASARASDWRIQR